ncbi:PLP-dependent aminotransferase family protein [Acinetobacter sp. MD2(2019)]|uniref:aminotransferase-like domain-containing protein n=1 Tax=Acinetobacter sp. MD2(2019) TaxID=2605273 RepID=UPI002D1F34F4|nr:PLP-dependent aminotransferase family protein [Acinetobacter sp. MD2(2019)]MEB3753178.1 PLP-dependent aminotransferase family protein [Acinetobacter sp. MD2(2019)]
MENKAKKSKIEQLMLWVEQQIEQRIWISGSRLPSVRSLAQQQHVSVSTVVEAYARLVAQDVLEARQGAGFFVKSALQPYLLSPYQPQFDRTVDPLWISRQSLDASDDVLKPGCGWLPSAWMPEELVRKAIRTVSRGDANALLNYATALGLPELRQMIARRLDSVGVIAHPDQVLLVESGTHAIDLICRLYLKSGDTVLIDDPCYFNFQALLNVHGVKTVAVPFTPTGPDLQAFEQALQHQPRLYITNSGLHNPTGASLSLQTAYQILKWAEQCQFLIIEDEIFADLEYSPAPRYAALGGFAQILQIGSFSKTISAAIRCGYIVADPAWIEPLLDLKVATTLNHDHFNAAVIYQVLQGSQYNKYLEWLKKSLAQAMTYSVQQLALLDIHPWMVPKAGMLIWCKLPQGVNSEQLLQYCLAHGVILAPGHAFSRSEHAEQFLRFNVAQSLNAKVFQVLADGLALSSNQSL